MRDHSECQPAIDKALAHGKPGKAEWYATRCDRAHGHLSADDNRTDRVAPVRAALAAERDDAGEGL